MLRESNKLFTAIAANEGFYVMSIDIRAVFLQSKELKREVFLVPPKDIAKKGIIWRMKKSLYGLNDVSRQFWLRVKEVFKQEKLKTLPGDEDFYYKHEGGRLAGMVITHVDDFQIAGNDQFLESLEEKLNGSLAVSKVDLVVQSVGDASYKCDDRSTGGGLMMLGNRKMGNVSPICWKSGKMSKVCHSARDAETRSIVVNVDAAVCQFVQLDGHEECGRF